MNKFFAIVAVLAHKEGHHHESGLYIYNTIFLNKFFEYLVGIFYGIIPTIFSFSHRKIHHIYNGGHGDTISIYDCDRTNIFHFVWYLTRFLLYSMNISNIAYVLYRNICGEMRIKIFLGSIYYYLILCIYLYINPILALNVIIIPLLITNFFFASFNWSWHGFLEENKNIYVSNTTILTGNNNFWGEDYHVQHHVNPLDDWQNNEIKFYKNKNISKIDSSKAYLRSSKAYLRSSKAYLRSSKAYLRSSKAYLRSNSTVFYYTNAFNLWMFMMLFPIFKFPLIASNLGYKLDYSLIKNYYTLKSKKEFIMHKELLQYRMKKILPYPNEFEKWYIYF